jgi:parallel beta-helix repeat protein
MPRIVPQAISGTTNEYQREDKMKKMNAGEFEFHTNDRNSVAISTNERRITLRKIRTLRGLVFAVLLSFLMLPAGARAQPCTPVVGAITYPSIFVTGTCSESVQIFQARSIAIVASAPGGASVPGGATIVGPQDNDAFDISQSQGIVLQNLEISGVPGSVAGSGGGGVFINQGSQARIIGCDIHNNEAEGVGVDTGSVVIIRDTTIHNNTPNDGLDVFDNSSVDVRGTTIRDNGDPGAGTVGVFVARNSLVNFRQDPVLGQPNLVQNNAKIGIQVRNLSNVVLAAGAISIQGHLTSGILIEEGSHLQVNSPRTVIQSNGSGCALDPTCGGILVEADSTADLTAGTVTGNHGSGISVQQGSNARLSGATVSNNTGNGVHIQWLSIGNFLSSNTISGNGGAAIFCAGKSFALGNLSTFSNVRCGDN